MEYNKNNNHNLSPNKLNSQNRSHSLSPIPNSNQLYNSNLQPKSQTPPLPSVQPSVPVNKENGIIDEKNKLQEILASFFPTVTSKSSDELFSLLTIESEFNEFFNAIPEVVNQRINLHDFQQGNEELALDTLKSESKYNELQKLILNKEATLKGLEAEFQRFKKREAELLNKFNPKSYLPKLQIERQQLDQDSLKLTDEFLSGQMELENYISEFRKVRKRFHRYDLVLQDYNNMPTLDLDEKQINFLR